MQKTRSRRILLLYVALVAGFVVLTGRLWYMQIFRGAYYANQAEHNRVRTELIEPMRGVIYDRDGTQLVANVPSFAITMIYSETPRKDRGAIVARLAELTGLEPSDFDAALNVAKQNIEATAVLLSDVPRDRALAVMQDHVNLPGIEVRSQPERSYPDAPLLSHFIGYVGRLDPETYTAAKQSANPYQLDDIVGKAGLERQYEQQLRGRLGTQQVEVDVGGRVIKVLQAQPATPGKSLVLTIDMDLELEAAKALQAGMQATHATTGAVVVLNAKSGEVLASVTMPSYDNNLFTGGIPYDEWQKLVDDPDRPLLDRAIGSPIPLGSMFEPILAAGAIQEGVISPAAVRPCSASIETLGTTIRNRQSQTTKTMTLDGAFSQGCDTFFATLAADPPTRPGLDASRIADYAIGFGLGKSTGIDVAGEVPGIMPSPAWQVANLGQPWTQLDTYNLALGRQNLLITPLQVAVAMSAIGNGGTLVQPRVVQGLIDTPAAGQRPSFDSTTAATTPQQRHVPVSASTLAVIQHVLSLSAQEGVGAGIRGLPMTVAGMPGTADAPMTQRVIDPSETSWWAGYAPAQNPEIAVVVVVPGGGTGEETALPIARSVIGAYSRNRGDASGR